MASFRVETNFAMSNRKSKNVFYFASSSKSNPALVANLFKSAIVNHILPELSSACELVDVYCQDDGGAEAVSSAGTSGSKAGNPEHVGTAAVMIKHVPGFRNGRTYWAGYPEQNIDGSGDITGTNASDIDQAFKDWFGQVTAVSGDVLGVSPVSSTSGASGVGFGAGGSFNTVTDVSLRPRVGIQRRRLSSLTL